jgi:hypothetical protein
MQGYSPVNAGIAVDCMTAVCVTIDEGWRTPCSWGGVGRDAAAGAVDGMRAPFTATTAKFAKDPDPAGRQVSR